ncbi:MAG: carbohydrate binding domain-containing protein [Lentisphaeria bacterium]|nr:carbohydrate binding domain-containing protein [Lentisphaeria bacterium]
MKLFSHVLLSSVCCVCMLAPCYGGDGVKNLIRNGGFEEGKKYWTPGAGTVAEFKRGYGRNQSSGIQVTVTPNRRGTVVQVVKGFERNQKYDVTAWIKADRNGFGTLTMDVMHKNGKYVKGGGFYHGRAVVNRDWTFFKQSYQHKGEDPAMHNYRFVLLSYFQFRSKEIKNPNATGKVWYDDIMVVPSVPEWTLNQVYPSHGAISVKGGKVTFSSFFEHGFIPEGTVPEVKTIMKYAGNKQEQAVKGTLKDGFIHLDIPAGKPGAVTLKIALHDKKSGKILGEKLMPLIIREELKMPANTAMLDEQGRLWVNGKKYMPLGVYCNIYKDGLSKDFLAHLDKIRNMKVFNTVMPYGVSFYIRSDKELLRLLDETNKRDMKLLLVVHDFLTGGLMGNFRKGTKNPAELEKRIQHIASLVGQHPGFLSYYGNDEKGVDSIGGVAAGRRLLNKYDPFHPVWGVSYQVEAYHKYLPSVDILAYDTYPVRKDGTNFHTRWLASRARSLTAAVWGVPQCYQRDEGVFLNVENMLSPCAVHIIYDAKGFVFWTTGPRNGFEKGDMEKRWGMLAEVGKTLKNLEDFILSDIPVKKLAVKNSKEEVEAALLDNGKGEYRIVAVGIHNKHLSEISIPENLKLLPTKFGRLKEKAPGLLSYEGGALTCDFGILVKR